MIPNTEWIPAYTKVIKMMVLSITPYLSTNDNRTFFLYRLSYWNAEKD